MLLISPTGEDGEGFRTVGETHCAATAAFEHVPVSGHQLRGDEEAAAEAAALHRDEHDRGQDVTRDGARALRLRSRLPTTSCLRQRRAAKEKYT